MLNGKKISRIGAMGQIRSFGKFVAGHGGVYEPDFSKGDIIVMSFKYYDKFIHGDFNSGTALAHIKKLVESKPEIQVMEETDFLKMLGVEVVFKTKSGSKSHTDRPEKGENLRIKTDNYTFIDLETTGKYVGYCEIIEMSAVRVRDNKVTDTFSTLIKPEKSIPAKITEKTGITDDMVADAPDIREKLPEFLEFVGDDIVVGHNIASFDSSLIYDLCLEFGLKPFANYMVDTLHYAHCCDIDVPDYKLTTLTKYFGIEHDAHRALNDCLANVKVYEKLKEKYTGHYNTKTADDSSETPEILSEPENISAPENLCVCETYSDLSGKSIVLTGEFECGNRVIS